MFLLLLTLYLFGMPTWLVHHSSNHLLLSQTNRDMMDYVGPVESLDAIEIFLSRSFVVVHHWQETVSKAYEKSKVMFVQMKAIKVEVRKTKQLGAMVVWLHVYTNDSTKLNVNCDVVDGEIARESQFYFESDKEEKIERRGWVQVISIMNEMFFVSVFVL